MIIELRYTRGARMEEPNHNDSDISHWEALGITADVIATILVLTTLFAYGGVMADRFLGTKFIFTVIGFILLIVLGYRIILKKAQRIAKRMERTNKTTTKQT